jgi:hypothetical protein
VISNDFVDELTPARSDEIKSRLVAGQELFKCGTLPEQHQVISFKTTARISPYLYAIVAG